MVPPRPRRAQSDFATVREKLQNSGALVVSIVGNTQYTSQQLNEMVAPVLARIQSADSRSAKAPSRGHARPRLAATSQRIDYWGESMGFRLVRRGTSTAVKDITKIVDHEETFYLNNRDTVVLQTSVSGLIGIGKYPQQIRDKVYVSASDQFPTGILSLPIFDDDDFKIAKCDMWFTSSNDQNKSPNAQTHFDSKHFDWQPSSGWVTPEGTKVGFGRFQFVSLPAELEGTDWRQTADASRASGRYRRKTGD